MSCVPCRCDIALSLRLSLQQYLPQLGRHLRLEPAVLHHLGVVQGVDLGGDDRLLLVIRKRQQLQVLGALPPLLAVLFWDGDLLYNGSFPKENIIKTNQLCKIMVFST